MSIDVARAAELNLAAHAAQLLPALDGAHVHAREDIRISDSGLVDDTFNIIACAHVDTQDQVQDIVTLAKRTGRPFSWWVGPASRPDSLSDLLAALGFPAGETELAMIRDSPSPPVTQLPDQLEIVTANNPSQMRDFAEVLAANWEPPAPTVLDFYTATAKTAVASDSRSHFLVGYLGELPVCVGEVTLSDGVAGIYNISTRAEFRGRGLGTAITTATVHKAQSLGTDTVVLQASAQGAGIYRSLGFTVYGEFREHSIT